MPPDSTSPYDKNGLYERSFALQVTFFHYLSLCLCLSPQIDDELLEIREVFWLIHFTGSVLDRPQYRSNKQDKIHYLKEYSTMGVGKLQLIDDVFIRFIGA